MRIAIDGHNLSLEKGTGIATYARNLSYALGEAGHQVEVLYGVRQAPGEGSALREISFFDPPATLESRWARPLRFRLRRMRTRFAKPVAEAVPLSGLVIKDQFRARLPHYDRLWNVPELFDFAHYYFHRKGRFLPVRFPDPPDVMHWTYPVPLRVPGAKNVYTLHDLIPLRLPYTTLDVKKDYFAMIEEIAASADQVVTVSECSKRDILEFFPAAEGRVKNLSQTVVIPQALLAKSDTDVRDEISGVFGLEPGRYFLFFGAIEPKKNIGRLIEGYLAANVQLPLVLLGAEGWKSKGELALLQPGGSKEAARRVLQFNYASFPQLISLIRGARAVTFPSLYEGFGLPPLEAMLCGTPVLTSNTSSLPEVVTPECAIMVDPYDPAQIREGIRRLAYDDELCARLGEAGRKRAEQFAWSDYVRNLEGFYAELGAAAPLDRRNRRQLLPAAEQRRQREQAA